MHHTRTTKNGFTLIEVLVVIAILGLILSLLIASLEDARARSRDRQRLQDMRRIQTALELYAADHNGEYPGNDDTFFSGCLRNFEIELDVLVPQYISSLPHDPLYPDHMGTSFCYVYERNTNTECQERLNHPYILRFSTETIFFGEYRMPHGQTLIPQSNHCITST